MSNWDFIHLSFIIFLKVFVDFRTKSPNHYSFYKLCDKINASPKRTQNFTKKYSSKAKIYVFEWTWVEENMLIRHLFHIQCMDRNTRSEKARSIVIKHRRSTKSIVYLRNLKSSGYPARSVSKINKVDKKVSCKDLL